MMVTLLFDKLTLFDRHRKEQLITNMDDFQHRWMNKYEHHIIETEYVY